MKLECPHCLKSYWPKQAWMHEGCVPKPTVTSTPIGMYSGCRYVVSKPVKKKAKKRAARA